MDLTAGKFHIFRSLLIIFIIGTPSFSCFSQDSLPEIQQILYITSNTGNSLTTTILDQIMEQSRNEVSADLILLGNFTDPIGEDQDQEQLFHFLRKDLIDPLQNFQGRIFLVPGENEWRRNLPMDKIRASLPKTEILPLPENACAISDESVGKEIEIVGINSPWFFANWDEDPEMNLNCNYKTREEFFLEFKDKLKDNQGKLILVAVHHPIMSNSKEALFKRITGFSSNHYSNKEQKFRGRLETYASLYHDVIFLSGNDRNLQFLHNGRNSQVISGATGNLEKVNPKGDAKFVSDTKGFAKLTLFSNDSLKVQFFGFEKNEFQLLYSQKISRERPLPEDVLRDFTPPPVESHFTSSIYPKEDTKKSKLYKLIWGDRYRKIYAQPIVAPGLYIDSLPGNFRPIAEGGGQQSRSLRLKTDSENEYVLRALHKDAIQYLQADVIKTSFIGDFLNGTLPERLVSDFFTAAHPYAKLSVPILSEAISLLHTNPALYYLPKQKALGIYNKDYGNALFVLEEHVGAENKDLKTFGTPDDIISTDDLLHDLKNSKKIYVDQKLYLRARIFDILIGDWDRHQDQWRWAVFENGAQTRMEPIPRDRDHAFPKYDGLLMPILRGAIPLLRKMQTYDKELENIKWFNWSGYPLDQRLLRGAEWEDWQMQVNFIQENLTDEIIDQAFASLPEEVRKTKEIQEIKNSLRYRRNHLEDPVQEYYHILQEFKTVTGTTGKDHFEIVRKENGVSTITIAANDQIVFMEDFDSKETKEIWIYGLDGEDTFQLRGKGENPIKLKILGGPKTDAYQLDNPSKTKVYDYASEKSNISNSKTNKWFVDSYEINNFHYLKRKHKVNRIIPLLDYVTDAGFSAGIRNIFTTYGLANNPYSSQYHFSAQYFPSSGGYELNASAEFAHIFYNWNLLFQARYTSPNYFYNFFGFGNETAYDKNKYDRDYHKVLLEQWSFLPVLLWKIEKETFFSIGPLLESLEVSFREGSYLQDNFSTDQSLFDPQLYIGAETEGYYKNKDNPSFPSLGSELELIAGYKYNVQGNGYQFGYIQPTISVDYPLVHNGYVVFATKLGGEAIFGEKYQFYHAADLGGNENLRGYRNHRFNGQYSFFHSTDLRSALGVIRTNILPLIVGLSVGYDYGRVWTGQDPSSVWHQNYGGSIWVNAALALTGNFGFYHGGDGNRLTLTLNFKF